MLPTLEQLRTAIEQALADAHEQGYDTADATADLRAAPDSLDALVEVAARVGELPLREGWTYVEPGDLDAIRAECDPARDLGPVGDLGATATGERIRAAFHGRICGCMLGKPFEIDVTYDAIREALEATGEWPLRDYPTEETLRALPTMQGQWRELVRGRITHVAPDDDINYLLLAMDTLERHGTDFTHDDMRTLWLYNLPALVTFGPERATLIAAALATLEPAADLRRIVNPGAELCGALIRADAYGYACIGRPELASDLAFRDASFTHRRTGVYGSMFVAAAIALAPFCSDPLAIFERALAYVPQNGRFAEATRDAIDIVRSASTWTDGLATIRMRFGEYGFCRIYQELATVINTLRFANDVSDGICIQVMQGNDTDSFGATAGSILGAFFGPGHLDEERFVAPLRDTVHSALANFHEQSLTAISDRMAALPMCVAR